MTEKTCGTCANGECESIRCLITQDTHVPCFVCADYIERADSLEQVALDMLEKLRWMTSANAAAGFSIYLISKDIDKLAERARALGVEVAQ